MKKLTLFLFAFLATCATSWALFNTQFFRVHDYVHAARIGEMLTGFKEGQLPVRWSSNFGYGYGMPLFEFYAPLPFIVGAFFFWLNIDVVIVVKVLYILANVLTWTGAYFLGKHLLGKAEGVFIAFAYTLAPYRAVNLYVRGALSEAWAMMALPWVLLGIVLTVQKNKYGFWVLLGSLVTLMLSHNLTTLMFVPISLLFGLSYLLWWKHQHQSKTSQKELLQSVGQLAGAYTLSIGLTAFYLFPALVEKDFTKIGSIFSGYFHYSHHFLYIRQFFSSTWGFGGSNWGPDDGISFFLGYGQLLGLAVTVIATTYFLIKTKKKSLPKVLWILSIAILFGLACFMTLMRSKFIWDAVPLLTIIQFPWRWLSVASLMLALLGGVGISLLQAQRIQVIVTAALCLIMLGTSWNYFRPESYMSNPHDLYYTEPEKIRREMSQILPDYIPQAMSDTLPPREALYLIPAGLEKQVEVLVDRGHQKLFKTTFLSPVEFNPLIASYPGWKVEIDGKPVEWTSGGQFGTILVDVPAGERLVGISLGRTPVRAVSDAVTLGSIVLLIGAATYVSYNNRSH
jgi:hypothetical protein